MLSTLFHGRSKDGEAIVRSALEGLESLERKSQELYLDIVQEVLGEIALKALEILMKSQTTPYLGEFAKKYIAEGEAKGKAEGKAEGILLLLRARGLEVDEGTRVHILACRDEHQLDRWLLRRLQARTVSDLFSEN